MKKILILVGNLVLQVLFTWAIFSESFIGPFNKDWVLLYMLSHVFYTLAMIGYILPSDLTSYPKKVSIRMFRNSNLKDFGNTDEIEHSRHLIQHKKYYYVIAYVLNIISLITKF